MKEKSNQICVDGLRILAFEQNFFQPLNGTYIQFYIDRGLYDTRFRYNLCCITRNLLKISFLRK